jgi:hypothetical protein
MLYFCFTWTTQRCCETGGEPAWGKKVVSYLKCCIHCAKHSAHVEDTRGCRQCCVRLICSGQCWWCLCAARRRLARIAWKRRNRRMKKFLLSFAYTLQAFRFAEFNALAELTGVEVIYNKEEVAELDSADDEIGVCLLHERLTTLNSSMRYTQTHSCAPNVEMHAGHHADTARTTHDTTPTLRANHARHHTTPRTTPRTTPHHTTPHHARHHARHHAAHTTPQHDHSATCVCSSTCVMCMYVHYVLHCQHNKPKKY